MELVDEAIKYTPPKKEPAPKKEAPKKEKPSAAAAAEEEDEPKPAPKPKHPLEALSKPKMPIDEMKRKYSNEDTPVALQWFWENMDLKEDYSLWSVAYKYDDELTMTFMSANLIGKPAVDEIIVPLLTPM